MVGKTKKSPLSILFENLTNNELFHTFNFDYFLTKFSLEYSLNDGRYHTQIKDHFLLKKV